MGTIKDIVDLSTQLASSVSDRKIASELNKIQSLTLKLQSELVELYEKNMKLHEEVRALQEANNTFKSERDRLESEIKDKGKIQYMKPSYWRVDVDPKDGPFCQRCYDVDKRLVRLQGGRNDYWKCPQCSQGYMGPAYRSPRLVR